MEEKPKYNITVNVNSLWEMRLIRCYSLTSGIFLFYLSFHFQDVGNYSLMFSSAIFASGLIILFISEVVMVNVISITKIEEQVRDAKIKTRTIKRR